MNGLWVVLFLLYFAPIAVAISRRSRNVMGVAVSSLIFGWTGIGWLLGLGMAVTGPTWNDALPVKLVTNERTCPSCAETVKVAAKVCRFCRSPLAP